MAVVLLSFLRSPDAAAACRPHALWTGNWFFAAPLVALAGLALTSRRSPSRATGLVANALLLAVWALVALPIWFMAAIANGASCGGG
jgi:hypothetical protein